LRDGHGYGIWGYLFDLKECEKLAVETALVEEMTVEEDSHSYVVWGVIVGKVVGVVMVGKIVEDVVGVVMTGKVVEVHLIENEMFG
jgi:hypothetical protein